MTPHRKMLTTKELDALLSYTNGVKTSTIAMVAEHSLGWVWLKLRELGLTAEGHTRFPNQQPIADNARERCRRCGILFAEADWIVVTKTRIEGVDGIDTEVDYEVDVPVPQIGVWRAFELNGKAVSGMCCDECVQLLDGTFKTWREFISGDKMLLAEYAETR